MGRSRQTTGTGFFDEEDGDGTSSVGETFGNGAFGRTTASVSSDGDGRGYDQGNIQEAESSLREGLSLNDKEARALLGRLEFQRGNIEPALRVFEAIGIQDAVPRLQSAISEKQQSRRNRARKDSQHSVQSNAESLVIEAIYLKSLCLQRLGKARDAAHECKSILDAIEKISPQGIPDVLLDSKLHESVSRAVELLPELWKQAGQFPEAMSSYRRALLGQWNLTNECCARIQKRFAIFLLYGGVEASPPSLAAQIDGCFVPKNNLEEAILLLLILLRKWYLGKIDWDPSVMEHFTFALSICSQTSLLARQFEEVLPGTYSRSERWNNLALCYSGCGQNKTALNLLRKSLSKHESPDDLLALLLAAKICSKDSDLAAEGVDYARRAVSNSQSGDGHLKDASLHYLGICLGKVSRRSSSDLERSKVKTEALRCLEQARGLPNHDPELLFTMALEYVDAQKMNSALRCAKDYVDCTAGSSSKGWRLLALILSAQQRYSEAEFVINTALEEMDKWERGPLLRIKAKLKVAQSLPNDAVKTYEILMALIKARKETFGSFNSYKLEDDKVSEFEALLDLADLYSSQSRWKDAEICVEKARALKPFSATVFHAEGKVLEGSGKWQEALGAYTNGLTTEEHAGCNVAAGALLRKAGTDSLPAARCFLSDALRLQPSNRAAWFHLGLVHRDDRRHADAADCFQAASALDDSQPLEPFISPS